MARSCVLFRLGEHDDLDNWHGIAIVDQLPGQPKEFLKIFVGNLLGPGFKPLVEEVGARTAKKRIAKLIERFSCILPAGILVCGSNRSRGFICGRQAASLLTLWAKGQTGKSACRSVQPAGQLRHQAHGAIGIELGFGSGLHIVERPPRCHFL